MRTSNRLGGLAMFACLIAFAEGEASASDKETCVLAAEKAQKLRDLGKYVTARRELLVCSTEACPATVRQDCIGWLADIARSMPTVVISVRDADGRDWSSVRVLVDGAVLAERLDGTPLPVDPGEHVFRFELPGRAPVEERALIFAGEHDRVIRVRLGGVPPAAVRAGAAESDATDPTRRDAAKPSWDGKRTAGVVVLAGGVVLAGIGAMFGARALSKNSDAKELCSSAVCGDPEAERLSRDAITDANLANLTIGVGLVALAVGAYLVLTSSSPRSPRPTPKATSMRLEPLVGRGVGGPSVGGAW